MYGLSHPAAFIKTKSATHHIRCHAFCHLYPQNKSEDLSVKHVGQNQIRQNAVTVLNCQAITRSIVTLLHVFASLASIFPLLHTVDVADRKKLGFESRYTGLTIRKQLPQ